MKTGNAISCFLAVFTFNLQLVPTRRWMNLAKLASHDSYECSLSTVQQVALSLIISVLESLWNFY